MGQLKLGERLVLSSNRTAIVASVDLETIPAEHGGMVSATGSMGTPTNDAGRFTVYNFQVEDYHTYYVTNGVEFGAVWVHNSEGCGITAKEIPTNKKGFDQWFDSKSSDEIAAMWGDKSLKDKITDQLRGSGGNHEFFLVAQAPHWKKWGIRAKQVKEDFAIPIRDLNEGGIAKGWVHSKGVKGSLSPGSGKVHLEMAKIIQKADSLSHYKTMMRSWAKKRLNGGGGSLPPGFDSRNN